MSDDLQLMYKIYSLNPFSFSFNSGFFYSLNIPYDLIPNYPKSVTFFKMTNKINDI